VQMMELTPSQDRRQYPRVPYGAWVEDLSTSGSLRFYLTRNLSIGGLLLSNPSGEAPPVGSRVRLRLIIENEQRIVTLDGQVVRHGHDQSGQVLFAVQFLPMDQARSEFLQGLIGELAGAQGVSSPS